MAPILNCIHGAFNRGLNYFSTFHPPKFPEVPFNEPVQPFGLHQSCRRRCEDRDYATHCVTTPCKSISNSMSITGGRV